MIGVAIGEGRTHWTTFLLGACTLAISLLLKGHQRIPGILVAVIAERSSSARWIWPERGRRGARIAPFAGEFGESRPGAGALPCSWRRSALKARIMHACSRHPVPARTLRAAWRSSSTVPTSRRNATVPISHSGDDVEAVRCGAHRDPRRPEPVGVVAKAPGQVSVRHSAAGAKTFSADRSRSAQPGSDE